MPMKPKRPCRMTSCRNFAVEGNCYCKEHKRQMDKYYEKFQRGYKPSERYDKVWRLIRDKYIAKHPMCEMCMEEGKATIAKVVHHKLPLSQGGTHDEYNLMSLCPHHHGKIHGELGDRWNRE